MESIKTDSSLPGGHSSFNKMSQKDIPKVLKNPADDLPWIVDGLAFPSGTEFRCKYKGYFYYGNVRSGALILNGKEFLSPSEAAVTITRNPVDGWLLWDCKLPGRSSWVNIYSIKKTNPQT